MGHVLEFDLGLADATASLRPHVEAQPADGLEATAEDLEKHAEASKEAADKTKPSKPAGQDELSENDVQQQDAHGPTAGSKAISPDRKRQEASEEDEVPQATLEAHLHTGLGMSESLDRLELEM